MAGKISNDDGDGAIAEINIVPFVDIVLVVLIIFMVTSPLIVKPSIKVNLPNSQSGDTSKQSKFNITIGITGELFLNGKPVSEQELSAQARTAIENNPETQAIISADKDVSHGNVVKIIDSIKSGGIHKFAITVEK